MCEVRSNRSSTFAEVFAMEVPTKAELRKLKVVELRQRLSALALPQGGELSNLRILYLSSIF